MNSRIIVGIFACLLCFCSVSLSQDLPPPQRYVEDRADIVNESVEQGLNGYLQELEQKTGAQVVVLTVRTTGSMPVEMYAIELATRWKLGQKGKDNGALIVIAKDDRAYRIEVGYGLEGVLPDSLCGSIGRTYFVPYFRQGKYSEGIYQGVVALVHEVAGESGVKITGMPDINKLRKKAQGRQSPLLFLFLVLFLLPVILRRLLYRRGYASYWGGPPIFFGGNQGFGGRGSGGFGSFGGGMGGSFGGGGASGRW